MKILLLCIFIALVARTRGKSSISPLPVSGVPGGSSSKVSGFYIPGNRGASSGGGSSYKGSNTGGNQGGGGRGNAFNLPGPIGGGSTFSTPVGNYGPKTSSGSGRSNKKGGGGGLGGSNFQRWTPDVEADLSSLPGPIGGRASGGINLPVGHAGAGSYGASSTRAFSNQGNNRGPPGDNNFQSSNSDAVISSFPGPIGGAGGNRLQIGNADTGSYGAPSASALSYQGDKRGASGDDNFQGRTNNQDGNGVADISNLPGPIGGAGGFSISVGNAGAGYYGAPSTSAFSNQGDTDNRGAAGSNSFQVWNSNRGAGLSSFPGPIGGAGGFGLLDSYGKPIVNAGTAAGSFQAHNAAHFASHGSNGGIDGGSGQIFNGVFGSDRNHASNFQGNNANLDSINNHGGGGFQGYNVNAGNVVEQGPIGGFSSGSFQGYNAIAGNIGNQVGTVGFGGGNFQGYDGNAGNIGNQGGIGAVFGRFQGHSRGSGTHSIKGGRSAGGRSFISRNFGGYSKVSVDHQTSEGLHVDPQLLDRIRTILYLDESRASSTNYGAPSSAYGVPRRGRVIGIQLGGISQSIHIAQFHQTSSGLIGGDFPVHTSAIIPSSSYGVPY